MYAYAPNATINNQTGAVFDFQSSASLANNYSYANPTFNNAGTLEMTAGSGTATVGFALNESGATSALGNSSSGTLSLSDGGSFGGTATVSGAVTLANGTFTVADGTTITPPSGGSGSLQVAGGTLSLAGSLTTTVLAIDGGTLAGTGTIAAGSQVTWSGGTLAGAVTSAGTLEISGNVEYLGGTLTNTGTIDVTGSGVVYAYAPNATINNQTGAVFDFQSSASLANNYSYANPTFNNAGTLEMTAGSGTATVGYSLSNTGTVRGRIEHALRLEHLQQLLRHNPDRRDLLRLGNRPVRVQPEPTLSRTPRRSSSTGRPPRSSTRQMPTLWPG